MSLGHGGYGRGDYGVGLYGSDEFADFPQGPLKWNVELLLGDWVDVTPLVYERDGISITGGRADEGSVVDYSKCSFTLNNRDGQFSPRNPLSPYYGVLGRNTQCRVSVVAGTTRLVSAAGGTSDNGGANTVDSAANSITGDIDVRWDGWFDSYRVHTTLLMSKYDTAGNQRSWFFQMDDEGTLTLFWSNDGTAILSAISTQRLPYPTVGRKALRATLDVDNGAAGKTVTFYTASSIAAGDWVQLGNAVTTAGTTSIFNSTAPVICDSNSFNFIYGLEIRSGINGTVVANPDFTAQADESISFTDASGAPWSVTSGATCSARRYRFWGEMTSLPQRWDTTGNDVWVPVQASGVMRRLGTGNTDLRSTLYRGLVGLTGIRAYWPCEDEAGSTSLASAAGGPPMTFSGTPTLAAFSDFKATSPIPTVNNSHWTGKIPTYTATGEIEVRFLLAVTAALTNNAVICRLITTGTIRRWDLVYTTASSGGIQLAAYSSTGSLISSTVTGFTGLDGKDWYMAIQVEQQGADVQGSFAVYEIGASVSFGDNVVIAGRTSSVAQSFEISPNSNVDAAAVGEISVSSIMTTPVFDTDLFDQALAYAGRDRAAGRVQRLCGEEGIAIALRGYAGTNAASSEYSVLMGAQLPLGLLDLLRECERTDNGILYETRHQFGLAYRPRLGLYNRTPQLTLSYTAHNLAELDDNPDDFAVVNDVTVSRVGGSSAHAVQDTGSLNVQDPPDGVGRYPATVTINNNADSELQDQASWRRRQGTVDEPRHPGVVVDLANPSLSGSPSLTAQVLDLELGDRLDVDPGGVNLLQPDDIVQALQGYQEEINTFEHRLTLNCVPDAGYQVAVYEDTGTRYSSPSTLGASYSSSDVSLSVVISDGTIWGHADGDFDIIVSGERMTVTAVAGAASPQTFTVTRSVNGDVKALTSGDAVALFRPAYYAL